ncbi:MAG: glycosyltransferase family 4 protein [Candidatus Methanoperedens sp.]|nr:glycosyltransferase family 4 protein [Candidatus Methanoperedens sp.]CAG0995577.1 hypothetical protein METP1_02544 [Methanosarcinales archaeon]
MKKITVLNDFPLYPLNHGGKIRIFNIYKELSKRFNVTYICFGSSKNLEITQLSENFVEVRVPKDYIHKKMDKVIGSYLRISIDDIIAMFFCNISRKLAHTIKSYLSEADIVFASHPYMYPIIKKYITNKFLVYEALNVEYVLKKNLLGDGLFRKALYNYVKIIEGELVKASDLIFVMSAQDMLKLNEVYNITNNKIHISPNGVNIPEFSILYKNNKLVKEKVIKQPLAIFMGSGHPPNVEAAKKIVSEIAPKMENVYFLICGSVCWSFKKGKIGKNIGLTFEVSPEEKLELYRVSDIALNPMLSGSGTNIKMLDYMASGLPVITTPTGARGLDVENYNHVMICEISEFPEKIREVLRNNELYDKLSHNGHNLVEEKYDWEKIAESMAKTLQEKLDIL